VIASRLRTVTPSAAPDETITSRRPYMDASRTPRPDGANTTSTATMAPTAAVPPRYGMVEMPGSAWSERSIR
jgi:hypothetical protein